MSRPGQVRFGPFRFDLRSGDLFEGTRRVPLKPQSITVLRLLVLRRGDLVSRADLQRALWGDRHVQAELGLNFSVRQVRAALGEQAERPAYIETVRGRGYRFVAQVREVRGESAGGRPGWIQVAAMLLVLAGSGIGWFYHGRSPTISLAVVRFANLTGATACGTLGDRAADTIRQTIGAADPARIRVLATEGPASDAGGSAEYLLVGAVAGEPGHRQVAVHLLRSRDGAVLWSRIMDPATALSTLASKPILERLLAVSHEL